MSRYNRIRSLIWQQRATFGQIWRALSAAGDTVPPRVQAARQIAPAMASGLLDRRAIRLRRD